MKVRIWKGVRRIERGHIISPSGNVKEYFSDRRDSKYIRVPVDCGSQSTFLKFSDYDPLDIVNPLATRILEHPYLKVRGTAYLITDVEWLFKLRAWGNYEDVMDALENVQLSRPPIVKNRSMILSQQDIYAANVDDLFAIRMCL